jgi:fumarylacetoacetate (FAA) hydrolase
LKLATMKDGTRDGTLVVVSRDLRSACSAAAVAPTLQLALEQWDTAALELQSLYDQLNAGEARHVVPFEPARCAAPLPRAYQWLDGSAFHSHGDLMQKVFGHEPIEGKLNVPLMYQGGSDDFLGPTDDMPLPSEGDGIDFEAELGVIVDRVPMSTPAARALQHVKLLALINDASLRRLAPIEMKTGFGFLQAKPATSFAPVAVTPDELEAAWRDGRVHLTVQVEWNGTTFGRPNAGEMGFGFHDLIAHAARTRNLSAGTIIGSGTISNAAYRTVGSACIAERRAIEMESSGKPQTEFMRFGDRIRIEMRNDRNESIFGAIDQKMVQAPAP